MSISSFDTRRRENTRRRLGLGKMLLRKDAPGAFFTKEVMERSEEAARDRYLQKERERAAQRDRPSLEVSVLSKKVVRVEQVLLLRSP